MLQHNMCHEYLYLIHLQDYSEEKLKLLIQLKLNQTIDNS